ncbi:MAG: carbohydrate-binding family 9-like protein [Cohnella sp.]|nr:carbohydrate-binding family 9-like protein [Cohnella sp.]
MYVGEGQNVLWSDVRGELLSDTITGQAPRIATMVKACWTNHALHIRFEYEDDHIVATMTRRDDPLYEEDVVEVFIDETGEGSPYLEFEVSPNNVVFDAVVKLDEDGTVHPDTSWDAKGLETAAGELEPGLRYAELRIPFENFRRAPSDGAMWRWNCYRIDDDRQGRRHYSAWSPTGKANFHVPEKFGVLRFVSG